MATTRITNESLSEALPAAKASGIVLYLWDTEIRGFGCRISPFGHVSWVFQHWQGGKGGKAKRVAFGTYPTLPLKQARIRAIKLKADANDGIDLVNRKEAKRKAKRTELQAPTVKQAVTLYIQRNRVQGSYWHEITNRMEREIIPALGADTPVFKITRKDLRPIYEAKLDKGQQGAARRMFATIRPFLKWCVEQEIIDRSPLEGVKPPKPSKARDRILNDAEIKSFWHAAGKDDLFGPVHRLLLLTAQRREEVAGLRWSELDLGKATWIIPKERTKNGKEHIVHLSPQAMAILPKRGSSDLVFTTTGITGFSGFGRAKERVDEHMAKDFANPIVRWVVHDLRRTAASGMAALGFHPHVIERVLNHISGATGGLVGVYQRYEYQDDRRKALLAWGDYVEKLVARPESGTCIVEISRYMAKTS